MEGEQSLFVKTDVPYDKVPFNPTSNSYLWKFFVRPYIPFRTSCLGKLELLYEAKPKFQNFFSILSSSLVLLTGASVLWIAILLLQVFALKKISFSEYDVIDEELDVNECGILNPKLLAIMAGSLKILVLFPLVFLFNKNSQLLQLFGYLLVSECSDLPTVYKFGKSLEKFQALKVLLVSGICVVLANVCLEFPNLFYTLEEPEVDEYFKSVEEGEDGEDFLKKYFDTVAKDGRHYGGDEPVIDTKVIM